MNGVSSTGFRVPALAALISLVLTGCATMSADQCMVADWYRLGEQDAEAGRTTDYLADRASACREAGYTADTDAWYAGFEQGLEAFCTLDSGFRFGVEGNSYQGTCPAVLDGEFRDGYQMGYAIHQLDAQIEQAESELNRLARQIDDLEDEPEPDRRRIRDLQRQFDRLDRQLRAHEVELATLRGVAMGRGFVLPR